MPDGFFPQRPAITPKIYAYAIDDASHKGQLKVGYTDRDIRTRIAEQTRTAHIQVRIVLEETAMRDDGSTFDDHAVHQLLKQQFTHVAGEWFICSVTDVQNAISAVRERRSSLTERTQRFGMRPEQIEAVKRTQEYFTKFNQDNPGQPPRFLWNAKMRFGKTFTSYEFAKAQRYKRVLVLTFKPAVENSWREDLESHEDFDGWQFISRETQLTYGKADKSRPIVCFGSFQDYLGKNEAGGIKARNEWVHEINWDLVIFDEYHFGAWRDSARELFEEEDKREQNDNMNGVAQLIDEGFAMGDTDFLPITTGAYLFLSGTPFRAIANGEFIEEQIFNWTYSDEQRAKEQWEPENADNPYSSLPRMVLMTYQMPDQIREIASGGEFDEFDLNEFFSAVGEGNEASFKHRSEVQKWLDLLRGGFAETTVDELKLGAKKPPMPFSDARLKNILTHTFWFMPSVASCYAMANLLQERQNVFFRDYTVNVAAGAAAGIGLAALEPVRKSMADPLASKTITLSCGKLTTGVTVKPWTGILMLRNLKSPETYFQAAFRVQSPWVIDNPDGMHPNEQEILKKECYVFDFAPTRALRQIADYSCALHPDQNTSPEQSVSEFIHFLPVLAYDGSSMKQINATDVLDIASSGTSATLLAKRWESALLVNVDDLTLRKLMNNQQAMDALMSIEGFRKLNDDLEKIINKSDELKEMKSKDEKLSADEKKQVREDEKETKSLREQIQKKLIKFATRIPIFMYLTDYREQTLRDVITKLEPELFKKVTGLTKEDFELLLSLNVFNSARMNDAVYKFKRYEDDSLSYAGIDKHEHDLRVGLFDTAIPVQEFEELSQ
ncbi:GIY-YIG nuclease family protein [Bifidobacterium sp.]|uniref:GIY-YIG nuclease family protein n=1 Tax=Bifidobacterium sp. TaxID=41200 RepID=UPI0025BF356D|nr:GIY-YIG nuclease family protein [Bifidobacterium sp.]MCI1636109.1 GIY-YIG nuclease family protein [Bifidobacterium sp.]